MEQEEKITVTSQTIKGLCHLYSVSRSTMKKWLDLIPGLKKPVNGYIYPPKEVKRIFDHLGPP